jgi:hypothetical protein
MAAARGRTGFWRAFMVGFGANDFINFDDKHFLRLPATMAPDQLMDWTRKVKPVSARKWLAATKCNEHQDNGPIS